jgi:hypothetical protein
VANSEISIIHALHALCAGSLFQDE